MIEEIKEIIEDCESVQESQESAYTKEQAKLSAYERIKEMAIKALEQEPKPCDTCRHYENGCHWLPSVTPLEQEPCEDAISSVKDLLSKVRKLCKDCGVEFFFVVPGASEWSITECDHLRKLTAYHKELELAESEGKE